MVKTLVGTPDPDPEFETYRVYRERYVYLISRIRNIFEESRRLNAEIQESE